MSQLPTRSNVARRRRWGYLLVTLAVLLGASFVSLVVCVWPQMRRAGEWEHKFEEIVRRRGVFAATWEREFSVELRRALITEPLLRQELREWEQEKGLLISRAEEDWRWRRDTSPLKSSVLLVVSYLTTFSYPAYIRSASAFWPGIIEILSLLVVGRWVLPDRVELLRNQAPREH